MIPARYALDYIPPYLRQILEYVERDNKLVLGIHSGTSADGPSLVLARVSGVDESARAEVLAHRTFAYPEKLRTAVLQCCERSSATVDLLIQTDMAVGEFFAKAAVEFLHELALEPQDIALVASSGQIAYQVIPGQRVEHDTVLGDQRVGMLDLGEGSVISSVLGRITVTTLRRKDNHAGGFGAPMVPFGDWVAFRSAEASRTVWNIGGISNATVLPMASSFQDVVAFDAGPGNMLIDQIASRISGGTLSFDRDGALASRGSVDARLLSDSLSDPFIVKPPPKAAARQIYGAHAVDAFWQRGMELGLTPYDVIATATALTAETIGYAQEAFIDTPNDQSELIFAGGGVLNPVLLNGLRARFQGRSLRVSSDFGVPIEAREALAMILIANQTINGRPSNSLRATGARASVVLGKIDVPS